MLEVLGAEPALENLAADGRFVPRPEWRTLTRFEARGERLGHGVHDLAFRRRAGQGPATDPPMLRCGKRRLAAPAAGRSIESTTARTAGPEQSQQGGPTMSALQPVIGNWYRFTEGDVFEIVALDADDGTIEALPIDASMNPRRIISQNSRMPGSATTVVSR
jgi:hypothetical protein